MNLGSHVVRTLALVAAASLAGCAGAPATRPEPPRLYLLDLRPVEVTLFTQTYRIRLKVQNPNPFALDIDGMAYEIRLNDQPFASGVSDQALDVPRYGTTSLEIDALGTLAGIFRQFTELERSRPQKLRYEVEGHLSLRGGPSRLPFDHKGEISLLPDELLGAP